MTPTNANNTDIWFQSVWPEQYVVYHRLFICCHRLLVCQSVYQKLLLWRLTFHRLFKTRLMFQGDIFTRSILCNLFAYGLSIFLDQLSWWPQNLEGRKEFWILGKQWLEYATRTELKFEILKVKTIPAYCMKSNKSIEGDFLKFFDIWMKDILRTFNNFEWYSRTIAD